LISKNSTRAALFGTFARVVLNGFAAEETGRYDFAVIENEAVPLLQILEDIEKVPVLDSHVGPAAVLLFISVYNKKPGGISLLRRLLCY